MALFYLLQLWAHLGLLAVALWLNRADLRMLAVTAAVGAGFYAPIMPTDEPVYFYLQCFLIELGVAFVAALAWCGAASKAILGCASLLLIAHATGAVVGPQPGIGPYRAIIPILELTQFLVCIFMSRPVLDLAARALTQKARNT